MREEITKSEVLKYLSTKRQYTRPKLIVVGITIFVFSLVEALALMFGGFVLVGVAFSAIFLFLSGFSLALLRKWKRKSDPYAATFVTSFQTYLVIGLVIYAILFDHISITTFLAIFLSGTILSMILSYVIIKKRFESHIMPRAQNSDSFGVFLSGSVVLFSVTILPRIPRDFFPYIGFGLLFFWILGGSFWVAEMFHNFQISKPLY